MKIYQRYITQRFLENILNGTMVNPLVILFVSVHNIIEVRCSFIYQKKKVIKIAIKPHEI